MAHGSCPGERAVRGTLAGTTSVIDTKVLKASEPSNRAEQAPAVFSDAGVSGDRASCVYDRAGFFSAPWVAWLMASHGHAVSLVTNWGEEGEATPAEPAERFSVASAATMNATRDDVLASLGTEAQIIDARSPGRFHGKDPEPRAGSRPGHIPGSKNLHYRTITAQGGYIEVEDIAEAVARLGVDLSKPIITTCGSGVTASLVAVALTRVGATHVRVYQGSWAEWGMDDSPSHRD